MNIFKVFLINSLLLLPLLGAAQQDEDDGMIASTKTATLTKGINTKYLEDQIYVGLTYNYLANKATNVVQHNLSYVINFGFIRDLPINEKRNIGFGAGLGLAYDIVYNNMVVNKIDGNYTYSIVEHFRDQNISRNYFRTYSVELPIEFRYRTSTPQSHKFWRIYTGARLSYIFSATSLYTTNEVSLFFDNFAIMRSFQLKPYIAFGYNALNFFVQYNVTPLLKNTYTTDGTNLKSNILQIGLMFYIL